MGRRHRKQRKEEARRKKFIASVEADIKQTQLKKKLYEHLSKALSSRLFSEAASSYIRDKVEERSFVRAIFQLPDKEK